MTSGWSIMLPPGWWHVALNQRRHHSVQAMLNRMLANLPRDQVGPWRRDLARELDTQVDAAAAHGAHDLYLLADLRYGTPVAASCLATVVETAPPAGTPARYLAVILAGDDGQPAVIEVDGQECAVVRRHVPGVGTLPDLTVEPPTRLRDDGSPCHADDTDQRIRDTEQQVRRTREHLDVVLAATVSARMEAYLPFPSEERMLILTFSTPITDLAEPMLGLFQAMTESLRWTQEPS